MSNDVTGTSTSVHTATDVMKRSDKTRKHFKT